MRFVLALLLAAAGCTGPRPEEQAAPRPEVPHTCPAAAKPPDPLPKVVTTEALRAWAEETEKARQETVAALKVCARRLARATEPE